MGRLQRRWAPEPAIELLPQWRIASVRSEKRLAVSPAAGRESPEANRRSRTRPEVLVFQVLSFKAARSAVGNPKSTRPMQRYKMPPSSRSRRAISSGAGLFVDPVLETSCTGRAPNRSINA